MINVRPINKDLAEALLDEWGNSPLLSVINRKDARKLLQVSYFATITKDVPVDTFSPELSTLQQLLGEYMQSTAMDDIFVPILLLDGYVDYVFSSDSLNSLPLRLKAEAPFLTYFTPHANNAHAIYPDFILIKGSKWLLFDPPTFRDTLCKNPNMYDIVLKEREKLYEIFLKWMPINLASAIEYRIARYLFALLPKNFSKHETIKITQHEIAEQLSCSRAMVTKGISFLYDRGIICTGYKQLDVDTNKLKYFIRSKQL